MKFDNSKYYAAYQFPGEFIRRNTILFLTVISFFVIGFDLTTEIAEQNNEVVYYTAILINSTSPSEPLKETSIKKTEKPLITQDFYRSTDLHSSELSETFQSRPPPIA